MAGTFYRESQIDSRRRRYAFRVASSLATVYVMAASGSTVGITVAGLELLLIVHRPLKAQRARSTGHLDAVRLLSYFDTVPCLWGILPHKWMDHHTPLNANRR